MYSRALCICVVTVIASWHLLNASHSFAADSETAVYLPVQYDPDQQWPVVILLHGAGATGDMQDLHLGISERVSSKGIILVVPEARPVAGPGMNSSDLLLRLIADISRDYSVDADRIFLIGHSMGGYQSLRFACDHGEKIAGMVISAASGSCTNGPVPVSLLLATGDADISDQSVASTISSWRQTNGCTAAPAVTPDLDMHWDIAGAESIRTQWDGCNRDTSVSSLRSRHGRHVPMYRGEFSELALDFLLKNTRQSVQKKNNCVAEGDDRKRFVTNTLRITSDKTLLSVSEYSDDQCQALVATVEFSGPGNQGGNQHVFGLKFDEAAVIPFAADVIDELNGNQNQRALCGKSWNADDRIAISGRSAAGRQSCVATMGNISGPASFVKRLILSYMFSPPLP
jgi:polyhydroxybutyrate depolymerase